METIETKLRGTLKNFAGAVVATCAPIGTEAFLHDTAHDVSIEIKEKTDEIFGHDLTGEVVADLDAKGLGFGNVHATMNLAAFAQGKAASPIKSVSVDKVKEIQLPAIDTPLGSIETSCTLTLRVAYERRGKKQQAVTTTMKIALEIDYASSAESESQG